MLAHSFPIAYGIAFAFGLFLALKNFPLPLIEGMAPEYFKAGFGDFYQHAAGQLYFLREGWHWPLLTVEKLNAPGGTNIAMTDSIPLEAILLKLLHPLFPNVQQGITLFLALCYTLQPVCAVFALRSMGERRLIPAIAVAVLTACFPTYLARIGHAALCAHWIILLALGLYFRCTSDKPSNSALGFFSALVPLTFLIHPYLMVMVAALLAAVPITRFVRERSGKGWINATAATTLSALAVFLTGAFLHYWSGSSGGGYGFYSMNLASPFWPVHSSLLPHVSSGSVEATGGQYEGYQYLGAGVLLLMGISLAHNSVRTMLARLPMRHTGLLLASVTLLIIALSNRMYLFHTPILLTRFHVPGADQMRSSGRMFWPVGYALLIGTVYAICRAFRRWGSAFLLAGAVLQWIDTRDLRNGVEGIEATLLTPVTASNEQLPDLFRSFDRLEVQPRLECDGSSSTSDIQMLYRAALANAWTNTMYTARMMPENACNGLQPKLHPLDTRTLVALTGLSRFSRALDWENLQNAHCAAANDAIFCSAATVPLPKGLSPLPPLTPLPLDIARATAAVPTNANETLGDGWSHLESWGTWSDGPTSELYIPLPSDMHSATLLLRLHSAGGVTQHVRVMDGTTPLAEWNVTPDDKDYSATITAPAAGLPVHVQLEIAHPIKINGDPRLLGIGILQVAIHKNP